MSVTPTAFRQVFISHASCDEAIALVLKKWIDESFAGGVGVFVSGDDLKPGENWRKRIDDELKSSSIVLVVCTLQSVSRPWVPFEAGAAWGRDCEVIPLCYNGMGKDSLPEPFRAQQAVDIGVEADVLNLLRRLAELCGFKPDLIVPRKLNLPARDSEASRVSTGIDFRIEVQAADLVSTDGSGEVMPVIIVKGQNHGERTVYVTGMLFFEKLDTGSCLVVHKGIYGEPLLPREVQHGDAIEAIMPIAEFKEVELDHVGAAYFVDKIGRTFKSTREQVQSAIAQLRRKKQ
jgi:hypothetical protein